MIWTCSDASSVKKLSISSRCRVIAGLRNTKTERGMACLTKLGRRDNEGPIIKGSDQDLFAYEFRSSLEVRKWGQQPNRKSLKSTATVQADWRFLILFILRPRKSRNLINAEIILFRSDQIRQKLYRIKPKLLTPHFIGSYH